MAASSSGSWSDQGTSTCTSRHLSIGKVLYPGTLFWHVIYGFGGMGEYFHVTEDVTLTQRLRPAFV